MPLFSDADFAAIIQAKSNAQLVSLLSTHAEHFDIPIDQMVKIRAIAFPRLATGIEDPGGKMSAWAARMREQTGRDTVTVKPGTMQAYELPWVAAFAVAWKGEAPEHWPTSWTQEHLDRVALWESGQKVPALMRERTASATLT